MKCPNCQASVSSDDKFCSECGRSLIVKMDNVTAYLQEMHEFAEDQKKADDLEEIDELGLSDFAEILKAQLRMMVFINRRLKGLENKEQKGVRVRVMDLDIPFWSLVNLEFKIFLVSIFFMAMFGCLGSLVFGSFLGNLIRSMMQFLQ
jgi:hypothetical protein